MLFETSLSNRDNFKSFIFFNPVDIIRINHYRDINRAFRRIEMYAKKYFLAGYFSYELGYFFENDSFKINPDFVYPLINLCVFDKAIIFNHKTGRFNQEVPGLISQKAINEDFHIQNLKLNFGKSGYLKKINRIKEYIRAGLTYQVNFTGKYHFDFSGSVYAFYEDLRNRQNVSYGAFLKFKDEYIVSLSPELFFRRDGVKIYSRPMKGTIVRGKNIAEDKKIILALKNSHKNQAENLMIVDLIRNDLGRISQVRSVKVSRLFDIEKYNTLFQMTSTVKSTLRKGKTYLEIFKNIFPGGSVTGAPKIRTMQIIKDLEEEPRNIYCGALGLILPKNKAVFNLPIRTISIRKNKAEMGIGGGIVIDSDPESEYEECLLKAGFLTSRYKPFKLIESLLWDKGYRFLKEHLRRMESSARYFVFYFDLTKIILELRRSEKNLKPGSKYKVRLLLDKEGHLETEYSELTDDNQAQKYIAISRFKVMPKNLFLYHKTTNRAFFDSEYNHYRLKGYFDVIFLNKRNEVTEGAISNIIIEKNKRFYTPPVCAGLLAGIFRGYLLKRRKVSEKIIYLRDLLAADKIFLCNSVRGLTQVGLKR